jgi:hypothetical protein
MELHNLLIDILSTSMCMRTCASSVPSLSTISLVLMQGLFSFLPLPLPLSLSLSLFACHFFSVQPGPISSMFVSSVEECAHTEGRSDLTTQKGSLYLGQAKSFHLYFLEFKPSCSIADILLRVRRDRG